MIARRPLKVQTMVCRCWGARAAMLASRCRLVVRLQGPVVVFPLVGRRGAAISVLQNRWLKSSVLLRARCASFRRWLIRRQFVRIDARTRIG